MIQNISELVTGKRRVYELQVDSPEKLKQVMNDFSNLRNYPVGDVSTDFSDIAFRQAIKNTALPGVLRNSLEMYLHGFSVTYDVTVNAKTDTEVHRCRVRSGLLTAGQIFWTINRANGYNESLRQELAEKTESISRVAFDPLLKY